MAAFLALHLVCLEQIYAIRTELIREAQGALKPIFVPCMTASPYSGIATILIALPDKIAALEIYLHALCGRERGQMLRERIPTTAGHLASLRILSKASAI